MRSITYTGTEKGMTGAQIKAVQDAVCLINDGETIVRHGDCIGGDDQFHTMAYHFGFLICIHPQNVDESKRAFANDRLPTASTVVVEGKDPIERNHDMVDASDYLVAAPYERQEILRSGVWATIRYARAKGVPVIIAWPDGTLKGLEGVL